MQINSLFVKNYRNLDDNHISLHPKNNFLVGDNGLGKSNFINLLNSLFEHKFIEEDFSDVNKEILVEFSLKLTDTEVGFFRDYFTPTGDDENSINIRAILENPDDYMKYFHIESDEEIPKSIIKGINFIKYDSSRNAMSELSFRNNKGIGRLLQYMVEENIPNEISNIIDKETVRNIAGKVNNGFDKLKILNQSGFKASIEEDTTELIKQCLVILDSKNYDIRKSGVGIQYSAFVIFRILDRLMTMNKKIFRKENYIFTNSNGEKEVSMILGLDEPEIHLHPYKQRNLVNYLQNIINNKDNDFNFILKDFFDIDKINGQSIIATHSPNVLSGNYKNIVRFYEKNSQTNIISGNKVNLDSQLEKHLLSKIQFFKESFFSRSNILIEGDTEYGALFEFSKKLKVDLDALGISIIPFGSKLSAVPVFELLKEFKINSVGLIDYDNGNLPKNYSEDKHSNHIYTTNENNFEEEIYNNFSLEDLIKLIEEDFKNDKYFFNNHCFFKRDLDSINIDINCSEPILPQIEMLEKENKETIKELLKESVCDIFGGKKGMHTGICLANKVNRVPKCYKDILSAAKRLSDDN